MLKRIQTENRSELANNTICSLICAKQNQNMECYEYCPDSEVLRSPSLKVSEVGRYERHKIWHSDRSPLEEQFCVFKIFKMFAIFKMAAKTRHKKWAVKIQHCLISSKFDFWVDKDVTNWFPTLKNFYQSPFSKWPPQYHTNSTLSDII
jgi:hypothetical protein